MRLTYRTHGGSKAYWQQHWSQIPADDGALNLDRYPGRYAEAVMRAVDGPVLEAGCGAGRVLLHYRRAGRQIVGMDFIEVAVRKIRHASAEVPLSVADVTGLPFADASFAGVLAFGLYHSLEHGVERAFAETRRIMRRAGCCGRVSAPIICKTASSIGSRMPRRRQVMNGGFTRLTIRAANSLIC